MKKFVLTVLMLIMASALTAQAATIEKQDFGEVDGTKVELYTLTNDKGAFMTVSTYGGIVTSLNVPDKDGNLGDVVLGFSELDGYLNDAYMASKPYFGCIVGRYSDRIRGGKFTLDGNEYTLTQNEGENTLHGGVVGFHNAVWTAKPVETEDGPALELSYTSPDGDQGFPGNLTMLVRYTLTNDNALKVENFATTDAPTVINMTHHSYFNLAGEGSGDVSGHAVMINADTYAENREDDFLIASGNLLPLQGTPLDVRVSTTIGEKTYINNYVLNKDAVDAMSLAAVVNEPTTGRLMQVYTTEPVMLFYTGHGLNGTLVGKAGNAYEARAGFCMETQHHSNSPNIPEFPSTVLRPGELFESTTIYKFSTF